MLDGSTVPVWVAIPAIVFWVAVVVNVAGYAILHGSPLILRFIDWVTP